ncbi:MAG: bile acid:sodium symporter [Rhodospirillales bacterium]|nr:bile acid:sodium symporter [Rhodospirillales bacterium]
MINRFKPTGPIVIGRFVEESRSRRQEKRFRNVISILKKHWFFVGIAAMILISFTVPAVGLFVHKHSVLKYGIFLAFFLSGLTLDTSRVVDQLRDFRVLGAAIVSSLVFFPLIGFGLAQFALADYPDLVVGVCIIAVAPATVAAGTAMTTIARGNVPLSLFICVSTNVVAVFTIPFALNLLLQANYNISLPLKATIISLTITVIIPTALGQLARIKAKEFLPRYKKYFSIFQQLIVLLIILNAVSKSTGQLAEAGILVAYAFAFMIILHGIILAMNLGISKLVHLDEPSTAAFTIHTSEKTLTVSYLVWNMNFAALFPISLIPAIAYHLTQLILDTFVAQYFLKRLIAVEEAKESSLPGAAAAR